MKNHASNLKSFLSCAIVVFSLSLFSFSSHAQTIARGTVSSTHSEVDAGLKNPESEEQTLHLNSLPSMGEAEDAADYSESGLMIYPNPIQDIGIIGYYGGEGKEVQLSIFDMNGKLVHQEFQSEILNSEIDFSSYQKGTYFVKVRTSTSLKTEFILIN